MSLPIYIRRRNVTKKTEEFVCAGLDWFTEPRLDLFYRQSGSPLLIVAIIFSDSGWHTVD